MKQIQKFSFKEMRLQMSSAQWRPFCLGLNVLICIVRTPNYYAASHQSLCLFISVLTLLSLYSETCL